MNSLEWRIKRLESQLLGPAAGYGAALEHQDSSPLVDRLSAVAKQYKHHTEAAGADYERFVQLQNQHKNLLHDLEHINQPGDAAKVDLVLAYEDELLKHMSDVELMASKAEQVLNIEKWPDLTTYQQRLAKLQTVTKEQLTKSVQLDQRTEELIDIYNQIISSIKSNIAIWNQKLEAYENQDKQPDQHV